MTFERYMSFRRPYWRLRNLVIALWLMVALLFMAGALVLAVHDNAQACETGQTDKGENDEPSGDDEGRGGQGSGGGGSSDTSGANDSVSDDGDRNGPNNGFGDCGDFTIYGNGPCPGSPGGPPPRQW